MRTHVRGIDCTSASTIFLVVLTMWHWLGFVFHFININVGISQSRHLSQQYSIVCYIKSASQDLKISVWSFVHNYCPFVILLLTIVVSANMCTWQKYWKGIHYNQPNPARFSWPKKLLYLVIKHETNPNPGNIK